MQKTIFITGASTGLGKATAKLFQSTGWKVIATMRNPENETELNQLENVTVLKLDVTNAQQINEVVGEVTQSHQVNVVFNNAGYGLMGSLESITDEKLIRQIDTNLLGVIRVTKAFIPYFRERKNGLFITTTSIGGLIGFPLGSSYHATKWALEGWTESMAFELAPFNIGIKTVAPGGIYTDFAGRSIDMNSNPAYAPVEEKLWGSFEEMMKTASTPEQIADVVYEAATDGKYQLRYVAGEDAKALFNRSLALGREANHKEVGEVFLG
ncbi:SDR family oxidoreductase [Olivibacter sp. SDN3]|uniref:SDR family oxidoreductase n=1 Tax=Olivibacter sp. SDN3 TaxID=2764720 RepID=UPI00165171F0|nr:SDR family oxidoreductase [Olivibacter sp. SDN3]QNL51933.1 SDR family oxidoreductase [Olivibacter sp. SDN3]